jgi:hypothetical protein
LNSRIRKTLIARKGQLFPAAKPGKEQERAELIADFFFCFASNKR